MKEYMVLILFVVGLLLVAWILGIVDCSIYNASVGNKNKCKCKRKKNSKK